MFFTYVAHAQYVVNHRPLTYVTQNEKCVALSPNMLLHGRNFNIYNLLTESNEQDPDFVLVDREWNSNYIDVLKEQHIRNPKHGSNKIKPNVGDVVILILIICLANQMNRIQILFW